MNEGKILRHGNCTIIIHRPDLTEEERAKREKQVVTVLESTMKTYIKQKENT